MPRHARQTAEALNLIGGEPRPLPPLYDPDDEGQEEGQGNTTEKPEVFDYEPLDMANAGTGEGPFNGSPVMISEDETTPGVLAMWYSTRKRIGFSWKPWMSWVDPITRAEISMKPKFWRANPRMGAFW
jgi:hypothetical protein